ncbi:MAG: histidine phosphatase family protein [Clostridia bacterium]|nr:histidine phosphatase family protein [Clostridia bacterium]
MIYFVRHGATSWNENVDENGNKNPRYQGRKDLSLNEKGISQAKEVAQKLQGINFDEVFCSPLKRAKETCEIIYDDNIIFDDRIIERDFGELTGKTKKDFDYAGFWNLSGKQDYQGAETIKDVEKRVFDFLDELKQDSDKNILIVAHSGIGRIMMSYFYGVPKDGNYLNYDIKNGQVLQFDYDMVSSRDESEDVLEHVKRNAIKRKVQIDEKQKIYTTQSAVWGEN